MQGARRGPAEEEETVSRRGGGDAGSDVRRGEVASAVASRAAGGASGAVAEVAAVPAPGGLRPEGEQCRGPGSARCAPCSPGTCALGARAQLGTPPPAPSCAPPPASPFSPPFGPGQGPRVVTVSCAQSLRLAPRAAANRGRKAARVASCAPGPVTAGRGGGRGRGGRYWPSLLPEVGAGCQ